MFFLLFFCNVPSSYINQADKKSNDQVQPSAHINYRPLILSRVKLKDTENVGNLDGVTEKLVQGQYSTVATFVHDIAFFFRILIFLHQNHEPSRGRRERTRSLKQSVDAAKFFLQLIPWLQQQLVYSKTVASAKGLVCQICFKGFKQNACSSYSSNSTLASSSSSSTAQTVNKRSPTNSNTISTTSKIQAPAATTVTNLSAKKSNSPVMLVCKFCLSHYHQVSFCSRIL